MSTTDQHSWLHEEDRQFFERELESFVPDRVFDSHAHLYHPDHYKAEAKNLPPIVGYDEFRQLSDCLHPGRAASGLFLPWPVDSNAKLANEWISTQRAADPLSRGLFCLRPEDDPEWVRDEVRRLGLHGLKCYHSAVGDHPAWEADIPDFLPEPIVKVAGEEGWMITLHMVKSRAVADPSNIHWIRHYCQTYPGMQLILAHSARGFQPAHNFEGLPQLVGLDNLYFDCSANCEAIAHALIIRIFGHERLLYGSDFPVSHDRGRSLGIADSFVWLSEDSPAWQEKHMQVKPVLVGLENLRSLKWACWSTGLGDSAVEDIFWNNAASLFGLGPKSTGNAGQDAE